MCVVQLKIRIYGINEFEHFIVVSHFNVQKELVQYIHVSTAGAAIQDSCLVVPLENHLSIWMCSDDVVVVTSPPPPELVMGITGNR